jgi:excisionase family DNA binding protein
MPRDAAFLPMKIVIQLTSLSRATIYRRVAAGRFPAPINLGGRRVAFSRDELDRWIANPVTYHREPPFDP